MSLRNGITMELEILKCDSCGKNWNRQKTRGRKPKLCPDCIIAPIQENDSLEEDEDELDIVIAEEPPNPPTKYPANTRWFCKSCSASVKIGVGLDEPPTHVCKKRLKRVYPLERV